MREWRRNPISRKTKRHLCICKVQLDGTFSTDKHVLYTEWLLFTFSEKAWFCQIKWVQCTIIKRNSVLQTHGWTNTHNGHWIAHKSVIPNVFQGSDWTVNLPGKFLNTSTISKLYWPTTKIRKKFDIFLQNHFFWYVTHWPNNLLQRSTYIDLR